MSAVYVEKGYKLNRIPDTLNGTQHPNPLFASLLPPLVYSSHPSPARSLWLLVGCVARIVCPNSAFALLFVALKLELYDGEPRDAGTGAIL